MRQTSRVFNLKNLKNISHRCTFFNSSLRYKFWVLKEKKLRLKEFHWLQAFAMHLCFNVDTKCGSNGSIRHGLVSYRDASNSNNTNDNNNATAAPPQAFRDAGAAWSTDGTARKKQGEFSYHADLLSVWVFCSSCGLHTIRNPSTGKSPLRGDKSHPRCKSPARFPSYDGESDAPRTQ